MGRYARMGINCWSGGRDERLRGLARKRLMLKAIAH